MEKSVAVRTMEEDAFKKSGFDKGKKDAFNLAGPRAEKSLGV